MISLFQAVVLAVIQGLTEFLPVSSSGHLAVLSRMFAIDGDSGLLMAVTLHVGSLGAITAFYFKTLLGLLKKENWKVIFFLFIGSIPAGIVGVTLKKSGLAAEIFDNTSLAAAGFLVTATLLLVSEKLLRRRKDAPGADDNGIELGKMTLRQAFLVGCAQAVAVLPGISRSGSTICAGLMLRLSRADAAAFSFLLALPAIAGGGLLELKDYLELDDAARSAQGPDWKILVASFLVSALVSFGALTLLVKLLKKGNWVVFSYYLYALGAATLLYNIYHGVMCK